MWLPTARSLLPVEDDHVLRREVDGDRVHRPEVCLEPPLQLRASHDSRRAVLVGVAVDSCLDLRAITPEAKPHGTLRLADETVVPDADVEEAHLEVRLLQCEVDPVGFGLSALLSLDRLNLVESIVWETAYATGWPHCPCRYSL